MKKKYILLISLLYLTIFPCFGLSYNITFTGSGVSTIVGEVLVQNLTTGITVTIPSGNILNLSDGQTAVDQLSEDDQIISIFPGTKDGISTISFFAKQTGNAQINAFCLDSKKIASTTANVETGCNSFKLSLPKGFYAIQVTGNGYSYSAKMINQNSTPSKPSIVFIGSESKSITVSQKSKSTTLGTTTMSYSAGDRLLFTGKSGINNTIITDVPTGDKTINFEFVTCTDGDGNNYKVVNIGTQTWMAENLKTTKYNDGTDIPLVTSSTTWAGMFGPAYCWFDNSQATYKNLYGALYNAYASNTLKLAPLGWHIATKADWTALNSYITSKALMYGPVVKALAANYTWTGSTNQNVIGNDLTKNNSTGFSAVPAGNRLQDGSYASTGFYCSWWCYYTNAYSWTLYNNYGSLLSGDNVIMCGMSIRCVKDN